jgi:hypothetical protein
MFSNPLIASTFWESEIHFHTQFCLPLDARIGKQHAIGFVAEEFH